MRSVVIVGLLLFGFGVTATHNSANDGPAIKQAREKVAKADTAELARGCNQFAFDLYQTAAKKLGDKTANIVLSPYSVAEGLALVHAGARGKTADEVAKLLRLKLKPAEIGPAFAKLGIGAGAHLTDAVQPTKFRLGLRVRNSPGKGVEVVEVPASSPAWKAGLRPANRIIRLGHADIRNTVDFANALDQFVDVVDGEVETTKGVQRFTVQLDPPSESQKAIRPAVVTGLWAQKGTKFLPSFMETGATYHNAAMENVDFGAGASAARDRINRWVAETTDDGIRKMLSPSALDGTEALVVTNTIYLQSNWLMPFDPKETEAGDFNTRGGKTRVMMMYRNAKFRFGQGKDFQVLEVGLEGDLAMAFYLPTKNEDDALSTFEQELFKYDQVAKWFEQLKPSQVNVRVPRFRVATDGDIRPVLQELGIGTVFGDVPDLSGMVSSGKAGLSKFVHNAVVEVSESGVRTPVLQGKVGGLIVRPIANFTANRPFLFTIRDTNTGVILFLGRVTAPQAE